MKKALKSYNFGFTK